MKTKAPLNKDRKEGRLKGLLDELKKETLDPALKEAEKIKRDAQKFADKLIDDAKQQKSQLLEAADREIDQKKKVFEKALASARRQAIDRLRAEIEVGIFNPEIHSLIEEITSETKVVRNAVEALVRACGASGDDLEALVAEKVSAKELAQGLAKATLKKLEGKIRPLKGLKGGACLRVKSEGMTLDLSSEVIAELIENYTRLELRGLFFSQEKAAGG